MFLKICPVGSYFVCTNCVRLICVVIFLSFSQQLEDERQKARDSHYERINAIHKLQDESKEMHDKEIEVLKNRFVRVSGNRLYTYCMSKTATFR